MIGTVFRSEDMPEDRFDCWRELMFQARSADVVGAHASASEAELRRMELGPVTVWHASFTPARFWRRARTARRSDLQRCQLTLLLDGRMTLTYDGGRTTPLGPRDLHFLDSSPSFPDQPHNEGAPDTGECRAVTGVGVDFPRELIPLPPQRIREMSGRGFSAREGTGALLADFLVGLGRQADVLRPCDAPRLGTTVLDLVSAWFSHALDDESALPAENRRRALAERIRAFVRQHLHDPEMKPATIAAAHHISLSHLHRVFTEQSGGETLAAWIRARRLEQAHRDLADPALRGTPIHTVAVRWGFPGAGDFTRAFRRAYGLSPREHRQRSLGDVPRP
ncbi:helix-turn-helix domain-containing protein [Streptomyces sp. NPDC093094]|uniref:helix-turn-helix domain-containing protein n=1 Tax=Streptomyces sp. NPDC093094 TaxID=3366026 RepID=UPI0037F45459